MKKFVCVLLIIAVIVSLCPAALADDVVETLKKRIEELENEIKKKDAIIEALLASGKMNETDKEKEPVIVQTEKGAIIIPPSQGGEIFQEPFFEILDARLKDVTYSKEGLVFLDLKVKCLYPKEKRTNYPDPFDIYLSWLDEDGVIVYSDYHRLQDLHYEDVAWTCSFHGNTGHDDEINLDEIKTVYITSYKAFLPEMNDWDEYPC